MFPTCINLLRYPVYRDIFTNKKFIDFKHPVTLEHTDYLEEYSKLNIRFSAQNSPNFEFLYLTSIPCGICSECLKKNALEWATRIQCETKVHEECYFVTYTYDDEHLPNPPILDTEIISIINKRLKSKLKWNNKNSEFRFYGCGEYGSQTARPHYHVIYFSLPLDDLRFHSVTENGDILYTSEFLQSVWPYGFVWIGSVTVASAAYVAHYCDKKKVLTSREKKALLEKGIVPEFARMSRNPGIGSNATEEMFEKIKNEISVTLSHGQTVSVPKYYLNRYKKTLSEIELEEFRKKREKKAFITISTRLQQAERSGLDYTTFQSKLEKRKIVDHRKN